MPAARAVCTHPESTLETAKKKDRARARMGGRIALPSIRQWVVSNTSSPNAMARAPGARDVRLGKVCAQGESATWLSLRSVSSWRRLRTERGRRG